jgi:multidrug resistance efflux pump
MTRRLGWRVGIAAAEVAAAAARHSRLKQGFREEEIREARSDWLSAEADLKLAEENLGRYDALLRRGSTTQAQVDMARADVDRSRGRALAARAHYDLVTRGNRPEEVAEAACGSASRSPRRIRDGCSRAGPGRC